ncbi:hypothetical protein QAD02_015843 [Eretmocerus hayati]|uniref:Uncharacterized protein n=1 Tax=Eretmocerus hayati TaxID=131215 RepID=A0ACC2PAM7_9HYME|nr:hypothetical protein QAD02_015843 [Eretmocerus hayati]
MEAENFVTREDQRYTYLMRLRDEDEFPNAAINIVFVNKDRFFIGAHENNHAVIVHESIQDFHCFLDKDDFGDWCVTNSNLGDIFINGKRLRPGEKRVFRKGDTLQLGKTDMFMYNLAVFPFPVPTKEEVYIKKEEKHSVDE